MVKSFLASVNYDEAVVKYISCSAEASVTYRYIVTYSPLLPKDNGL